MTRSKAHETAGPLNHLDNRPARDAWPKCPTSRSLLARLANLVQQVPRGQVTTYGALAHALGSRTAARWVAQALALLTPGLPVHRVVRHTGEVRVARFALPTDAANHSAVEMLRDEGLAVSQGRVELASHFFQAFRGPKPLAALVAAQERMHDQIALKPWPRMPRWIGGVDISYLSQRQALAVFVLVDSRTRRAAWSSECAAEVDFPYIPGLLTFRELPVYKRLLAEVAEAGRLPEVLLVDGTGMLHPREMGIATHVGIACQLPTIGVAKKRLCGQLAGVHSADPLWRDVLVGDRVLGAALARHAGARPLFISPGQGVDMKSAVRIVRRVWVDHRLPEPTYWADRISRTRARELFRAGKPR